jgi:endonuclease III
MPRESTPAKAARARQIISVLKKTYPDFRCELNFANPLQLLIATILSAQCTDKRVNMVTPNLFKKYRTAADFADARIEELEELIKTTGFFHNKAKNIKGCCQGLVEKHGGEVPKTMDDLHALPGVGRKTANVVLAEAFRISVGVIVDTHVTRLTNRFGIIKGSDAVKIETELMKLVPQEDWIAFSHCLVWHGRRRCDARKPDCGRCEITDVCPKLGVK